MEKLPREKRKNESTIRKSSAAASIKGILMINVKIRRGRSAVELSGGGTGRNGATPVPASVRVSSRSRADQVVSTSPLRILFHVRWTTRDPASKLQNSA